MGRKRRKSNFKETFLPLWALFSRLVIVFLIIGSIALIIAGRFNEGLVSGVKQQVTDTVVPVFSVLAHPVETYQNTRNHISNFFNALEENTKLRTQLHKYERLQEVVVALEAENHRLRDLLKMAPEQTSHHLTARVVGDTSSAFTRSIILSLGRGAKVNTGQIVTSAAGLVGRVQEAGDKSARVMLITDLNSRVPVITEKSRERAILTGNNSPLPQLSYYSPDNTIRVGERVLTTGDGKYFPAGVLVGEVHRFAKGAIYIKPFVNLGRLDYVNILMLE